MGRSYLLSLLSDAPNFDLTPFQIAMKTEREKSLKSLAEFKRLRDAVLEGENIHEVDQAMANLVDFLDADPTAGEARRNLPLVDFPGWLAEHMDSERERMNLPLDPDEKAALLLECVRQVQKTDDLFSQLMGSLGIYGQSKSIDHFKTTIFRPAMELFGEQLREVVALATPESRALVAVPPHLVPHESMTGIFLSHRTPEKPRVQRYYTVLQNLGYSPWLDIEAMPAGTVPHRGIQDGIEKSCAAVFFVTESFTVDHWIATEIEHAIERHTKLGPDRFSIITLLCYPDATAPKELAEFIFKHIENDLDGLNHIVRGLPIQLGPPRWRK